MLKMFFGLFALVVIAFGIYMWNEKEKEGSWERAGEKLELRVKNWASEWEHYFKTEFK